MLLWLHAFQCFGNSLCYVTTFIKSYFWSYFPFGIQWHMKESAKSSLTGHLNLRRFCWEFWAFTSGQFSVNFEFNGLRHMGSWFLEFVDSSKRKKVGMQMFSACLSYVGISPALSHSVHIFCLLHYEHTPETYIHTHIYTHKHISPSTHTSTHYMCTHTSTHSIHAHTQTHTLSMHTQELGRKQRSVAEQWKAQLHVYPLAFSILPFSLYHPGPVDETEHKG